MPSLSKVRPQDPSNLNMWFCKFVIVTMRRHWWSDETRKLLRASSLSTACLHLIFYARFLRSCHFRDLPIKHQWDLRHIQIYNRDILKILLPVLKDTDTWGQTCSMPWGVLSLDVNSGKTWWSTVLLSIAPDCPCYNVLYDRGFLWWNDLNPMKIGKNPLGSWIQGSAGSAGSLAFFSKFWFDKRQNWIGRERGI